MQVQRIAAFTNKGAGGNPAGVVLCDNLPELEVMQSVAAHVGYSETAFAAPTAGGAWRVRYFSPELEVPFCGHATIALGAALAGVHGAGQFPLIINDGNITVTAERSALGWACTLQSMPTHSSALEKAILAEALALFGYAIDDLDPEIAPRLASAGAQHLIIALRSRTALSRLNYELETGKRFMRQHRLVTIMFISRETDRRFHARNAFASGGVFEDPATGAAAAALAGMLRDLDWPHEGDITILQGEDMGSPSHLQVTFTSEPGAAVHVHGETTEINSRDIGKMANFKPGTPGIRAADRSPLIQQQVKL